jgi:hypothetical protein
MVYFFGLLSPANGAHRPADEAPAKTDFFAITPDAVDDLTPAERDALGNGSAQRASDLDPKLDWPLEQWRWLHFGV